MKKGKAICIAIALALVTMTFIVQPVSASSTRLESLRAYIDPRYDPDTGAYGFEEGGASWASATYSALTLFEAQNLLDARPPIIDMFDTKNFTARIQWDTGDPEEEDRYGGFSRYQAGPVDMRSTYVGIELWRMISEHQQGIPNIENVDFNETAVMVFLNKTQNDDGGFGSVVGADSDMLSTYQGLYIMSYIDSNFEESMDVWLQNETMTYNWIMECFKDQAFLLHPDARSAGVTPTATALMALDILDRLTSFDAQDVENWLINRQITEEDQGFVGGFEEGVNTNDTNIISTYYALEAFTLFGSISSVNTSIAEDFILSCQAADGSWGLNPGVEEGSFPYIAYAISSLDMIDAMDGLNEIDPNSENYPLIDWRIALVIGVIVAAVIIGILSVKMD
ncbi:MAG: conserved exported protein of unknown function [Candidatus Thorarchaeota archaeon]|nr:MAG: conserved exported protein of unknown function [Candidatus Thorarchaeota archaeon]